MVRRMERLVTLFGGGGFLGRYVAQALLKGGARIRIAEREGLTRLVGSGLTNLAMLYSRLGRCPEAIASAEAR